MRRGEGRRRYQKKSTRVRKILICGNLTLIKLILEIGYPREVVVLMRISYPRH